MSTTLSVDLTVKDIAEETSTKKDDQPLCIIKNVCILEIFLIEIMRLYELDSRSLVSALAVYLSSGFGGKGGDRSQTWTDLTCIPVY